MAKPRKPTTNSNLAKLPPALRRRAEALHAGAQQRIANAAHDALDRARAASAETRRNLYELGRALADLKEPGMSEAAGFSQGFYALCVSEFDLARVTVDRLLTAVANVSEEQYAALKPTRVRALLELAAATPEDDTAKILSGGTLTLWKGGPVLKVGGAKTSDIVDAAVKVRKHYAGAKKGPRGKSATEAERALGRDAGKKLKQLDGGAAVKVRATKPGAPSVFDLVGLSATTLKKLLRL